jgi:hypothetical protein
MDPDPAGDRSAPPPRLRVLVGYGDRSGGHCVYLLLGRHDEYASFARAFDGLGWEVAESPLYRPLNLVVTDNVANIDPFLRVRGQPRPLMVVIVDSESDGRVAEMAGADHILYRPIDLLNPLESVS